MAGVTAAVEETEIGEHPFWCHCATCMHEWAAAYFPMELAKFAKIAMAHSTCPKCGAKGFVGRAPKKTAMR